MRRIPVRDNKGNYNYCPYGIRAHNYLHSNTIYLTSSVCRECKYFVQELKDTDNRAKYTVCSADETFTEEKASK